MHTLIVYNYFKFEVYTFDSKRDISLNEKVNQNFKLKRGIILSKCKPELWGLFLLMQTLIVNNYFKFQVNYFDSNRDNWHYQTFYQKF